jgi:hypothetical protein
MSIVVKFRHIQGRIACYSYLLVRFTLFILFIFFADKRQMMLESGKLQNKVHDGLCNPWQAIMKNVSVIKSKASS